MPDKAPGKLFHNLPTLVPFALSPEDRLPHGLCWFTDKDGNHPDIESVWRDFFDATDEEIGFANDKADARKTLSEQKLFEILYKHLGRLKIESDDEQILEIGLGKASSSNNFLYAIGAEPEGLLAVGRSGLDKLVPLIEDFVLFFHAMKLFLVHPSHIASGKEVLFMEESDLPSDETTSLGPWNFAALRGSSLSELKSLAAATLATIVSPDRLWAAYLRTGDSSLSTAVFSLVEAGGKILDEPEMQFDVSMPIKLGTVGNDSTLRLLLFWQ